MAGATFSIISKKIGEGGVTHGIEVRRIQQLLVKTGHNPVHNMDGSWGNSKTGKTAKAWMDYQARKGWIPKPFVEPWDAEDRLGALAEDAGVLLDVPSQLRSKSAVSVFTDTCISSSLVYGWWDEGGGSRMVWGFKDRPSKLIFTCDYSSLYDFKVFDVDRSLNCCSYVNLMLSIWSQGNAHSKPYDASQNVGGQGVPVSTRFGLPEVLNSKKQQGFDSLDEVKSTVQADRIYHMSLCQGNTLVTSHDLIVVNNEVYQANRKRSSPNGGAVYVKTLDQQWRKHTRVRLFGPGPF